MSETLMLPDNRIRSIVVQATEERRLVTGLIVSNDFAKAILPKLYLEYFTNVYLRRVAEWCSEFYNRYSRVPSRHIQDIFDDKKNELDSAEQELISTLLSSLSDQYDEGSLNTEYMIESATNYFRKRELEIHQNNVTVLLRDNKIDEAEEEVARFQTVALNIDESLYIDPGDQNQRRELYDKYETKQKEFFRLPGDLGNFIGSIKQGDVIGIVAKQKAGKSHLLNDFFKHLILQKRKTVKFAIEMTDVEEITRFDKLFFPSVDTEEGEYRYPCFDCIYNQNGDCADRESKVIIRDYGASDYEYNKDHVPCTKCRYTDQNRFLVCSYEQKITRQKLESASAIKEMYKYKEMLSKYARIVVRPKYTLTYDLMMYDLDMLYKKYDFIPQAILIDYIDIMIVHTKYADYRIDDEKWKMMQQLASTTKCVVITPTQANRAGIESATLKQTDQGGFYGKGRHVNLMLGVNQTADEKRNGMYRVNILDGRSVRTNEDDFCIVLQDLKSGQMHLDSYWPNQEYRF